MIDNLVLGMPYLFFNIKNPCPYIQLWKEIFTFVPL